MPLVPAGGWMIAPPGTIDFKTMRAALVPSRLDSTLSGAYAGTDQDGAASLGVEYALGDGLPRERRVLGLSERARVVSVDAAIHVVGLCRRRNGRPQDLDVVVVAGPVAVGRVVVDPVIDAVLDVDAELGVVMDDVVVDQAGIAGVADPVGAVASSRC